jgi:hypothetical protein
VVKIPDTDDIKKDGYKKCCIIEFFDRDTLKKLGYNKWISDLRYSVVIGYELVEDGAVFFKAQHKGSEKMSYIYPETIKQRYPLDPELFPELFI